MVETVADVAAAAAHTRQETQVVAHGTHVLVRAVRVVIPARKNALLQTVAALVHHLVKELAELLASHQRKSLVLIPVLVDLLPPLRHLNLWCCLSCFFHIATRPLDKHSAVREHAAPANRLVNLTALAPIAKPIRVCHVDCLCHIEPAVKSAVVASRERHHEASFSLDDFVYLSACLANSNSN